MNILHISGVGNWGGGENHIQNLCIELRKSNPEVNNIIVCVRGGKFEQKLQPLGFKVYTSRMKFRLDPQYVKTIIRICKSEAIDLIHLHDPTAMQLAVIADHFSDLPNFILSRKISYPVKPNFLSRYKYNYKKIKKYLCVSKETQEVLARAVKDKSKIVTIYHGTRIDDKSDATPFKLRDQLKIAAHKKIIGNVANHYPAKDLPTLVKLANDVINIKGRNDVHFVQIGKPSDQTPAIMELVDKYGLQNHISFLGFVEQASNFIPQFDLGLMTSQFEGIPQFIYECFYHQVPMVTTNAGGTAEAVELNKTGFIADKGDYHTLSKYLIELLDNPEQAKKLTENAHNTLLQEFITPVMAQKTLAIYRDVLVGN